MLGSLEFATAVTGARLVMVRKVTNTNVTLNMKKLCHRSGVMRKLSNDGTIGLVGAIADLNTGKVNFMSEVAARVR